MTPIRLDFSPRRHQREAHHLRKRFTVLVWHRRAGKTVFAIVELLLAALRFTSEAGRYGYIGPLLKQTKAIAWDYLKRYALRIPGVVPNETELSVRLPNGAEVRLHGADNPDSFRGIYLDGVVLDEVAQMKPQVWGEILRPAIADRKGWALFIGTPKGVNLFSELYQRARRNEDGMWHADLRRADDTDALAPDELAALRRELTPAQQAQELDCDFDAAVENVLLRLSDVLSAMSRQYDPHELAHWPRIMGVDCALYGDDDTVFAARQGPVAFPAKRFHGLDQMEVAAELARSVDRWQPHAVFIDVTGGYGGGALARLRQLGYLTVHGVLFSNRATSPRFRNKRAEMWWDMATWVKGAACLPDSEALRTDLTAPTYSYDNAAGVFTLESKDDMRARGIKSPDEGDALALTFASPVPLAMPFGFETARTGVKTQFDPFSRSA